MDPPGTPRIRSMATAGSLASPWPRRADSSAAHALSSAEHQRSRHAGSHAVTAPLARTSRSASASRDGRAVKVADTTPSGSGHRPKRSTPTCIAPLVRSHSLVTRDASNPPMRSTTSGRTSAAKASWRSSESKLDTRPGRRRRTPLRGSASTGQPRWSASRHSVADSRSSPAERSPHTSTPLRPPRAVASRPTSSSKRPHAAPVGPAAGLVGATGIPGWQRRGRAHQRLAERQIQVHRSRQQTDGAPDRVAGQVAPPGGAPRRRWAGLAVPARGAAVEVALVDGLGGSRPAAREVGRRSAPAAAPPPGRPPPRPRGSAPPRCRSCTAPPPPVRRPVPTRAPGRQRRARRAPRGGGAGDRRRRRPPAAWSAIPARSPRRSCPGQPTRRPGWRSRWQPGRPGWARSCRVVGGLVRHRAPQPTVEVDGDRSRGASTARPAARVHADRPLLRTPRGRPGARTRPAHTRPPRPRQQRSPGPPRLPRCRRPSRGHLRRWWPAPGLARLQPGRADRACTSPCGTPIGCDGSCW